MESSSSQSSDVRIDLQYASKSKITDVISKHDPTTVISLDLERTAWKNMPKQSMLQMNRLRRLYLNGCFDQTREKEEFLRELASKTPELSVLGLAQNMLTSIDWIDCYPMLNILDLSRNEFQEIPVVLSKLVNLTELNLSHNRDINSIPQVTR